MECGRRFARRVRLRILAAPVRSAISEFVPFLQVQPERVVPARAQDATMLSSARPARWLRLSFTETAVPADYLTLAEVGAFLKS